ncbi:MAG TPA: 30S ribosomal protein S12 methylthiotransferase RimO [Candidatus Saccharicenans sp.]|nr:30S ribosomal protein S12 methylthiotransferase RimO [Candidatus Saccharicenans sp.]HPU93636.1 30S ribosomal protein S12 methylthiotransferase RimO [Candidatus Saccharicenans sp.]
MSKIALITLGCAKNLVDSEVILGCLHEQGHSFTANLEEAEVVIINTCGFIQPARAESQKAIEKALAWKEKDPRRRLAVVGCLVERYSDYLKARYPEVDFWSGVTDFDRLGELLQNKRLIPRQATFLLDDRTPRVITTGSNWAYVKISEGCSHHCSFCSIPLIKGPYKSRSIASIVSEVGNLASLGIKEINLVSQDSTYFGRDRGLKDGLVRLLDRLIAVKGIKWIRWLYGYPEEITDDLLEIMNQEKICPYFDLPFQHASATIVKKMGRTIKAGDALHLIEKIRKRVKGAVIRTSLIVGFPGEGLKEFSELKQLVREARFEHLGVFTYSAEPGTRAYHLEETISPAEKEDRRQEIMAIQKEISRDFYRTFKGQTLEVLLEDQEEERAEKGALYGRAKFQAPEVDGRVIIKDKKRLLVDDKKPDFIRVKINGTRGAYDLVGETLDVEAI